MELSFIPFFSVSVLSWIYFLIHLFIFQLTCSFFPHPSLPVPHPDFPHLYSHSLIPFSSVSIQEKEVLFSFFFSVACLLLFWNRFFLYKKFWLWCIFIGIICEYEFLNLLPLQRNYGSLSLYMLKLLYACTEYN